jgi:hypothetical protein
MTIEAEKEPWLDFDLHFVGPNSDFKHVESLPEEQKEKIGGVEYRALRLLTYYVPAVSICLTV